MVTIQDLIDFLEQWDNNLSVLDADLLMDLRSELHIDILPNITRRG